MSAFTYKGQAQKTRWDRLVHWFAKTRLGSYLSITLFPIIDRRLLKLSRGRLGVAMGQPNCLVNARGAKTGQLRPTPLFYTPHGGGFVIIASKVGAEHHPAWYHNLKAHPDVEIVVGGQTLPVRAREIPEGPEREELWALAVDNYSGYELYQRRAPHRRIPVLLLEPR